jgi:membrane protein required for colicin V production
MDFNYIDIAIAVIILITALIGFMRGFVWMAIFLATWSAAILLAIKFKDQLATVLPIKLGSEVAQIGLAALLIFIGVLIVGAIINYLFGKAVSAVGLGTFDRILGTGLGIALGALAITLITMLLSLTEFPNQSTWQQSRFVPKFQEAAAWLKTLIPEDMNKLINDNINNASNASITPGTPQSEPLFTPENSNPDTPANADQ